MVTAVEYGVGHKLLLGSDYPSGTVQNVIDGLRAVNAPVADTSLPHVPTDIQDRIIHDNWRGFFGEGWLEGAG